MFYFRLERADSIIERFSSVIGERPSSSALLSSATVSSDAKLLKEALSSIDHNISAEVPPERKSKGISVIIETCRVWKRNSLFVADHFLN